MHPHSTTHVRCAQSGVYQITHQATGHRYIGSAVNLTKRWWQHKKRLESGTHVNPKLQAAWMRYGRDAFAFAVLEVVDDKAQLLSREQWYLDTLQPWFNIAPMASNPMLGRKHTPAHSAAIKATRLARGGYTVGQDVRARIAATLRGRPGRPKTIEERQHLSAKLMGHPMSELTRAKLSAKAKGYRHTDDAKRRIGAASKINVTRLMREKSRFSPADILRIRELRASGMTCKDIAPLYGVTPQTIGKIALRRRWADVSPPTMLEEGTDAS